MGISWSMDPQGFQHTSFALNVRQHALPPIAPEGATYQRREKAKQYPPAVWQRGADGKLERIVMSIVQKEYKKFNRDMFALTFGHHDIPPMAQQMSQK
jgi:hypothetical protein